MQYLLNSPNKIPNQKTIPNPKNDYIGRPGQGLELGLLMEKIGASGLG